MRVIQKRLSDIKPYERNTKRHSKKQIDNVAQSIKEYGFVQPVVIDRNGVIVIGHCRTLAAKQLGMEEIPCVCVDDLDEKQVRMLRIIDNKTNESPWDKSFLPFEIKGLDFSGFDFGIDFLQPAEQEAQHKMNQQATQMKVENILNLGLGQYDGDNKYDIPELEPVHELPPIREWIGFNYVLSDKDPEGKAVHFFVDDYQFERLWNHPERYLEKLSRYAAVATPDFSPYGDMPFVCQLYNHYRKHWIGAWMQENGITVVPTIRCSTDRRSLDWYLDGEPHGGVVLMSSMWTGEGEDDEINHEEYRRMKEVLKPSKILIYGGEGNMGILPGDNVEYISNFSQERWKKNGKE